MFSKLQTLMFLLGCFITGCGIIILLYDRISFRQALLDSPTGKQARTLGLYSVIEHHWSELNYVVSSLARRIRSRLNGRGRCFCCRGDNDGIEGVAPLAYDEVDNLNGTSSVHVI